MAKKTVAGRRLIDGLPVIDAPKDASIDFTVNKEDVRSSKKSDPRNCAAARAISREYKTEAIVHISRTYVKSEDKKSWIRYKTPESISREITSFDRGHSFEPGEYYISPMSPAQRLGTYKPTGKTRNKSGRKSTKHHRTVMIREDAPKK